MFAPTPTKSVLLSIAALMLGSSVALAETAASRWLDAKPVVNWNKPGGPIPRGPKVIYADEIRNCEKRGAEETKKRPATPETRQVTAAGWVGAAVDKRRGDTVIGFA